MSIIKKYILPFILGGAFGILVDYLFVLIIGVNNISYLNFLFLFLFIICTYIIHIALHECGHLIGGLMSGYEFISYRFGSFMWVKQEGKVVYKQMSVKGTAGQCLMIPPNTEHVPYMLYNAGGGLLNIIVGCLSLCLIPLSLHVVMSIFLLSMFIMGLVAGSLNLIPMVVGGVPNDGYNILSMLKKPVLVESLCKQLNSVNDLVNGKNPSEYDEKYFEIPKDTLISDPLNTYVVELKAERYLVLNQIEEAKKIYLEIYENKKVVGAYRFVAQTNLLLIELFGECDLEVIHKYYDKEMRKRVKANYTNIALILIQLGIAKYVEHDEVVVAQCVSTLRKAFEKSPIPYEVEMAQRLLNQILSQND